MTVQSMDAVISGTNATRISMAPILNHNNQDQLKDPQSLHKLITTVCKDNIPMLPC